MARRSWQPILERACAVAAEREHPTLQDVFTHLVDEGVIDDSPAAFAMLRTRTKLLRETGQLPGPRRGKRILMTCVSCRRVKPFSPYYLRARIRRGGLQGAAIDWKTWRGTQPKCWTCNSKTNIKKALRQLTRRHGRRALVEHGYRLIQNRTPEEHARTLALAQAARKGRPHSKVQRRRIARAGLDPRMPGQLGLCRICGLVCYKREPRPTDHVELHMSCWNEWRRGRTKGAYPSRPRGRRPSASELMDSYEMVVCHRFRGETIDALAERFVLDAKTVEYRMKRFLAQLPTDERGGKRLHRRALLLLD